MQAFISYTHRDAERLDRFVIHTRAIERLTPFRFWYDKRRLQAGDQFDDVILEAIAKSQVFILLVSPDFFASDYIFDKEIPAIGQRQSQLTCPVIPVILQRCLWETWLEGLLAVPERPVLEWVPTEHGYDAANREIAKKVYSWCKLQPSGLVATYLARGTA